MEEAKKKKPLDADENESHYKMYGKAYHEAKYSDEICPICKSRIDELGYCACGAGGS
ncbi:MAG: hypothetical protein QXR58_00805 [Candidatus Micrarchaeaceae archaeon]